MNDRDAEFERRALACLPDVARFARSLTRNESAADDLVQETFLRAYRGYASFQQGADVRRWLFSICHHAFLRIQEREQRVVLSSDGGDPERETMGAVMGHVAAQRTGLDAYVCSIDVGPAIRDAIEQLAPVGRVTAARGNRAEYAEGLTCAGSFIQVQFDQEKFNMAASTVSLLPVDFVDRRRMGAQRWLYAALAAVTALIAVSDPLHAQMRGGQASARFGIATPSIDYQSNCGHSSLALGIDVQGRGRWFPQLSLDRFSGSGGGDQVCLPITPSGGVATGGLRIENATRLTFGGGGRVGGGTLQLEGAVLGGVIAGRRGFQGEVRDNERQMLPTVGGQLGVVLFRYAVLSAAVHWTRLSRGDRSIAGSIVTTSTDWSPMAAMQFGVRVPWGQQ